jgi:hypothetical protein
MMRKGGSLGLLAWEGGGMHRSFRAMLGFYNDTKLKLYYAPI